VAPSQFEIAPIYEQGNLATDHNQLVMTVLRTVAKRYGMTCLLHEKPFAGINGSGKHLNYSIGNDEIGCLFDPGDTPHENAQFLVFCAAAIRSVHKYGALLRATVANASNDHRLGANEAPPAIMSVYLGEQLTDVFEQIKKGEVKGCKQKCVMNIGVDTLPPLPMDPGDRNRTSPFAFTGNRFEFRAVGSTMSIAGPQVALNTMMAESLDYIATELEKATGGDSSKLNDAVQALLQKIMIDHESVIFNGDGYSEEWHQEAEKRGLANLRATPDALPMLSAPETIELFTKYGVLSEAELKSRQEIYLEQYCKTIETEANLMLRLAKTVIFPACFRYQSELATACANLKAIGKEFGTTTLDQLTTNLRAMQKVTYELEGLLEADKGEETLDHAKYFLNTILPAMGEVRKHADVLETLVADDLWTLPSYQEMLFVR
jgi:glutamine synthetase